MDHPKDHSLFGLGLPRFVEIEPKGIQMTFLKANPLKTKPFPKGSFGFQVFSFTNVKFENFGFHGPKWLFVWANFPRSTWCVFFPEMFFDTEMSPVCFKGKGRVPGMSWYQFLVNPMQAVEYLHRTHRAAASGAPRGVFSKFPNPITSGDVQVTNSKKNGCLGYYIGDDSTQLCGDYNFIHFKDPHFPTTMMECHWWVLNAPQVVMWTHTGHWSLERRKLLKLIESSIGCFNPPDMPLSSSKWGIINWDPFLRGSNLISSLAGKGFSPKAKSAWSLGSYNN